ncbi:NUDIX domain-containing protein [Sulfurimonas sp. HSL3-7]|uniref:NUDIX domain-containing protein n=1 Tax=Sulfonitrofixus jiaomeiensis TaxID=3131938 RepID=UPI0031F7FAF8
MYKIENISFSACADSNFVKSKRMHYTQGGEEKTWDLVEVHDSVAVLIYHKGREAFVLVKQFRPPVYLNNRDGFTYELCAGIVDKDLSLLEIAQEEILEETGYAVKPDRIKKVTSFYTAVGFAGAKQELYYVAVDDEDRVSDGGGIHDEAIEVVYLPVHEAKEFIYNESKAKTPGIMFAMTWWFSKLK